MESIQNTSDEAGRFELLSCQTKTEFLKLPKKHPAMFEEVAILIEHCRFESVSQALWSSNFELSNFEISNVFNEIFSVQTFQTENVNADFSLEKTVKQ